MKLPFLFQWIIAVLLLIIFTFANHQFVDYLGLSGVVSSFLIYVVFTTYCFKFPLGLIGATSAFLIINFFFINPLYTWEVAEFSSWIALLGFLVVSIVISTLIRKLRNESENSESRRQRAELSKALAEEIAGSNSIDALFSSCCSLIYSTFDKPVAIAQKINGNYSISHQAGNTEDLTPQSAVRWAANSGKMAGPGTDNWPELTNWIIPFERLPTSAPVLLIAHAKQAEGYLAGDFRVMTDQLCNAYQRSVNMERARQAELLAREESVHNTFLASISHDMRTPLTGIIGAAGTLLHQQDHRSSETTLLLESILSEAEQLAASTENILSLVQLESRQNEPIELDWQSPEEIVGMLMKRYRDRGLEHRIKPEVMDNTSLIKGHATLLTQALFNLIENALNVQPEAVPVIVRVQLNHQQLDISVLDEGPGFPAGFNSENIAKFASYKNKSKHGFGLGLAIAQAVAQKHQATLIIGTRDPVGSVVTLSFSASSVVLQNE